MNEIKATLYKTDGTKQPLVLNPKNRLETLQGLVEGYIEIIHIMNRYGIGDNGNDLVVNEEGRLFDLPPNCWSPYVAKNSVWENEIFRGDIVLIEGVLP